MEEMLDHCYFFMYQDICLLLKRNYIADILFMNNTICNIIMKYNFLSLQSLFIKFYLNFNQSLSYKSDIKFNPFFLSFRIHLFLISQSISLY